MQRVLLQTNHKLLHNDDFPVEKKKHKLQIFLWLLSAATGESFK